MSAEHLIADGVEVITSGTRRRRERNAARVLDILPPSKEEKLEALSRMTPDRQVEHVTGLLVQSHAGLLVAIAAQDLPGIAEAKQKAATIQEIVKQLRMGKDMQLHAAEFCRRAERGLGVAIREGQERGEVGSRTNGLNNTGPRQSYERNGKRVSVDESRGQNFVSAPSPRDFASRAELFGSRGDEGIYAMTDGVSDEAFEEAISEAREEGNLSRANVARKCKTKARGQEPVDTDEEPASTPAPAPRKRLTKHDSTEMLANINGMLNGIVESIPFIDPAEIDASDPANRKVIANIRNSMGSIRKLLKEIENG